MKLETWMNKHELGQSDMARLVGVPQPLLWKWLNGALPRADFILKMERVTRGKVRLEDWVRHFTP